MRARAAAAAPPDLCARAAVPAPPEPRAPKRPGFALDLRPVYPYACGEMRRGFLALTLAVVCTGLLAQPALAGIAATPDSKNLSYKAWPGEANRVSLVWGSRVTVSDPGALLVLGCLPLGLTKVSCQAPVGPVFYGCDAACHATVTLGDGNDQGVIDNAPASGGLSVAMDGGAGNDFLLANTGILRGGDGDDTLVAVTSSPGSVAFECGPGEDYATLRPGDTAAADCEHVARPAGARAGTRASFKRGASAAIEKAARTRRS